jgi:hypothetical protein
MGVTFLECWENVTSMKYVLRIDKTEGMLTRHQREMK